MGNLSIDLKKFTSFNTGSVLLWLNVSRIIVALKAVLAVVSLVFVVSAVREVLHTGITTALEPMVDETALPQDSFAPKHQRAEYQQIVSRNIFGELGSTQSNTGAKPAPKPISSLPLELIGTFRSDGLAGYAIIENKKKSEQDAFSTGDSIFGDAILKKIMDDRVEIERNGQIEILETEKTPGTKVAAAEGGVANVDGDQYVVDERELDAALENLPLLLSQARAIPYFQDGRAVGLRMFAIRSGSLYEKVGLKNGDILKSINGQSLADPTQALKLFEQLKEERSIGLQLERNREQREFKYEIR